MDGRRRTPKRTGIRGGRLPNPSVGGSKPPALLVKSARSYPEVVKTIKDHMSPGEFDNNVHFNKSRKGELLIRFTNSQTIDDDLKNVRGKLSDMGPEVIRKVVTLGRLDRILILDIDPSITEDEILEALRKAAPPKTREYIKLDGLWETSSGYAKALASVPRGVFSVVRRIRIGFFLCRIQLSAPPPPRCYKCHDFGHFAKTCEGPNLGGTCRRYAGAHSTKECTEGEDRCVACDRRGIPPIPHKPGSVRCGARTEADNRPPASQRNA